jgi:hypothetical protein
MLMIYIIIFARHTAGHLSQGYPGGKAIKVRVQPPQNDRRKFKAAAYVVFEGLMPGIYDTW